MSRAPKISKQELQARIESRRETHPANPALFQPVALNPDDVKALLGHLGARDTVTVRAQVACEVATALAVYGAAVEHGSSAASKVKTLSPLRALAVALASGIRDLPEAIRMDLAEAPNGVPLSDTEIDRVRLVLESAIERYEGVRKSGRPPVREALKQTIEVLQAVFTRYRGADVYSESEIAFVHDALEAGRIPHPHPDTDKAGLQALMAGGQS